MSASNWDMFHPLPSISNPQTEFNWSSWHWFIHISQRNTIFPCGKRITTCFSLFLCSLFRQVLQSKRKTNKVRIWSSVHKVMHNQKWKNPKIKSTQIIKLWKSYSTITTGHSVSIQGGKWLTDPCSTGSFFLHKNKTMENDNVSLILTILNSFMLSYSEGFIQLWEKTR